jgi:hypothetical protein
LLLLGEFTQKAVPAAVATIPALAVAGVFEMFQTVLTHSP